MNAMKDRAEIQETTANTTREDSALPRRARSLLAARCSPSRARHSDMSLGCPPPAPPSSTQQGEARDSLSQRKLCSSAGDLRTKDPSKDFTPQPADGRTDQLTMLSTKLQINTLHLLDADKPSIFFFLFSFALLSAL